MDSYFLLVLGTANSGKTVFISSLYKRLGTQGNPGFLLKVDHLEQRAKLAKLYAQIADTSADWPPGTTPGTETTWNFTCAVNTNGKQYEACRFAVWDYAGGRLISDEDASTLRPKLGEASSILIVVDGTRIINYLRGTDMQYVIHDLPTACQLASSETAQDVPLHIIVTKWDVLEVANTSLETVRNALMEVDEIRNLIEARKRRGVPVRIIPVSGVGRDFARLTQDGQMKKLPGKLPHPFQVEMALACAITDAVRRAVEDARKRYERETKRPIVVEEPWWAWIVRIAASITHTIENLVPKKYQTAARVLGRLATILDQRAGDPEAKWRELAAQKEGSLAAIKDQETAFEYVLTCFADLDFQLMSSFPESVLS